MQTKAILLDADGVVWRGGEAIPEAPGFISAAQSAGIRVLLVSNNAGPNRAAYAAKCQRLGLPLREEDIYSTNYLAGQYLTQHFPDSSVLVVGSRMLLDSVKESSSAVGAEEWLSAQGISSTAPDPSDLRAMLTARFDVVLIGMDIRLNYLNLCLACVGVQHGAVLIGTNPDYSFPVEAGIELPGNGSMVELVGRVSGQQPVFLGKPETHLLELIERETGIEREGMLMIGDRLETDIEFARRGGVRSLLVLTGVTARSDLSPDFPHAEVIDDLAAAGSLLGFSS